LKDFSKYYTKYSIARLDELITFWRSRCQGQGIWIDYRGGRRHSHRRLGVEESFGLSILAAKLICIPLPMVFLPARLALWHSTITLCYFLRQRIFFLESVL